MSFGKEAVSLASDIQEVQNVVDTAFGNMAYKCEELAKVSIEQLGMSSLAAKNYSSTYMAMGRGMGLSMENASDMAIETTKRVADVASFYNKDFAQVDTMMKSIWTGETESLKQIGVVMTETNLEAFALSQGIRKNIDDMTQAEKTQLRYAYVMQQTNLAAGDFAKTSDSWANQTRILQERWREFLSIMGTGLVQVLTPALRFLNTMMQYLTAFAKKFSEITAKLFGKQTLAADEGTAAVGGLADAEDTLAKNTDKATKAANRSLAGFDELNRLNDSQKDKSSNDTGAGGDLGLDMGSVSVDTTQAEQSLGALDGVVSGLKQRWQSFCDWFESSPWKAGFDNLGATAQSLWQIFTKGIENSKPKIGKSLSGIAEMFKNAGLTAANIYGSAFETVTENIRNWVSGNAPDIQKAFEGTIGIITSVVDTCTGIVNDLLESMNNYWVQYGQPIVDWVSNAVLDIYGWLLKLYNEFVVPIIERMLAWVNKVWNENLKGVVDEVLGFVGRIGELLGILWEEKIKPVVDWLMTYVVPVVKNVIDYIIDIVGIVWNFISGTVKNILGVINGIIDFLVGVFTGNWERAWGGVVKIFTSVKNQFSNIISSIKDFFISSFNYIKEQVSSIWEAICGTIKSVINKILSNIEGFINNIINGINFLIDKLNSLSIDLPQALGGGSIGFNIRKLSNVSLPRLATGTVVPANFGEFAAILGDNKREPEVVSPVSTIKQALREVMDELGGRPVQITVYTTLDGKIIGRSFVEYHNGVVAQTGVTPLKGV